MSDETVSQFVSRLRGLASTCNFGTFLPRALRDQIVVGCRNSESQHKLLQEDRSFDQCVAIAAADEAAVREFKQLQINNEGSFHLKSPKKSANLNSSDPDFDESAYIWSL